MKLIRLVWSLVLMIAFVLSPFFIVAALEEMPVVREIVMVLGILFIGYILNRCWKELNK